jgi:hypothetical protein
MVSDKANAATDPSNSVQASHRRDRSRPPNTHGAMKNAAWNAVFILMP